MSGSTNAARPSNAGGMSAQQKMMAANAFARAQILGLAVDCTNKVYSSTFNPSGVGNNTVYINPRPVGLIKGFWVHVLATVTNSGTAPLNLTSWGPAALLSQILFNDVNSYQRINTTGKHLEAVNTAKTRRPFGTVFQDTVPIGYGDNFNLIQAPPTIAVGATGIVEMWYWLPLAYSNHDLRGAIYANIVNATMQLQLVVNSAAVIAAGSDATQAVYTGAAGAAGSITSCTIELFQNYLDQLPVNPQTGQVFLPQIDLSWVYELKYTTLTGLSVGADFPVPISNFRNFYSMFLEYDNGGQLNAGTDINTIGLQSANFTNLFLVTPRVIKLWERGIVQTDYPNGSYYVDFRGRPLSSVQYGNLQIVINPSVVNSGAQINVGYEDLGMANTLIPAGSLPAG